MDKLINKLSELNITTKNNFAVFITLDRLAVYLYDCEKESLEELGRLPAICKATVDVDYYTNVVKDVGHIKQMIGYAKHNVSWEAR